MLINWEGIRIKFLIKLNVILAIVYTTLVVIGHSKCKTVDNYYIIFVLLSIIICISCTGLTLQTDPDQVNLCFENWGCSNTRWQGETFRLSSIKNAILCHIMLLLIWTFIHPDKSIVSKISDITWLNTSNGYFMFVLRLTYRLYISFQIRIIRIRTDLNVSLWKVKIKFKVSCGLIWFTPML